MGGAQMPLARSGVYSPLPCTTAIPSLPPFMSFSSDLPSENGSVIAGPIMQPYACFSPEKLRLTTPRTTEP